MGQYWKPVNLTKREFIHPHKLDNGLKLWEQATSAKGVGQALIVLLAGMPERRGGGDLQADPIVGRWAGDRVVLVGDYAEDGDIKDSPIPASLIYHLCVDEVDESVKEDILKDYPKLTPDDVSPFTDVSALVAEYIHKHI